MKRRGWGVRASSLLIAFAILLSQPASSDDTGGSAAASAPERKLVERGEYLTNAGNCFSCHTRPGGAPFAGGVAFPTPFGVIYSTNITPDVHTGIGRWSAADLRRAMHEGVAANGNMLFPAFPYTSFTLVSDADVDAIYAFLRTVKPVSYRPPDNGFLFKIRWPLRLWNTLYFDEQRFRRDPTKSAEWNRGAYLVEGLGHCSSCHTPRTWLMGEDKERRYAGGSMQEERNGKVRRWSAPNLTSAQSGLAAWSVEELARYLHTGFSRRAGTFGPMNEVIVNSLMKLDAADVRAMAVYLKSLPPNETPADAVPPDQVQAGKPIYAKHCAKCHGDSGRGNMFGGPPLDGSAIVQSADPASLINVILYGPEAPKDVSLGVWETMPGYGDVLSDEEVASVINFTRGSWGNRASPVRAETVAEQR